MQFPMSPTKGCASPAQRVAGGCLRKHGSLRKHMPNLSLRKKLCLHQNIWKIFPPPCPVCWTLAWEYGSGRDPWGCPRPLPHSCRQEPAQQMQSVRGLCWARQLSGTQCTAWGWRECASWGEKKVPQGSPVYISAESILIKLCKIKLHRVQYCFSSSLSTFRWRQKLMIEFQRH